ncbi:MAG: oligopeptide/dipeptide ABC transporter ATP-binding protein [Actinomycetota bacterium]
MNGDPLLEVRDLRKAFPIGRTWYGAPKRWLHAVDGVSFTLHAGETLGLVGESGCGKSTTARTILGLHPATSGEVYFKGEQLTHRSPREWKKVRQRVQMIFQDPYASLDPRQTVGSILTEPLKIHRVGNAKDRRLRAMALLDAVGLNPRHIYRYPHEFSGGQRQRIGIARALALEPELIVCDEPVSALDVSIQAQIINLLKELQERFGLAYLFIAHDLAVVKNISDRVAVMYLGKMCEVSESDELYAHPAHPYTELLLDSLPEPDPAIEIDLTVTSEGELPSPIEPPSGCRFRTRCPYATEICTAEEPQMRKVSDDHFVACHHPLVAVSQAAEAVS